MRHLVLLSVTSFVFQIASAQSTETISHDRLQNLLSLKAKMEKEGDIRDSYTINIFTGTLKDAQKKLKEFENLQQKFEAALKYEAPNFKIYVGNFRTRLQADRALLVIKEDYPNAVVLKP